jgi:hypothetical protein
VYAFKYQIEDIKKNQDLEELIPKMGEKPKRCWFPILRMWRHGQGIKLARLFLQREEEHLARDVSIKPEKLNMNSVEFL